jgi:hypothetical protein
MRELAAGEHKEIRGIDDLGLKLKQSFHCNFAKDLLFIFFLSAVTSSSVWSRERF